MAEEVDDTERRFVEFVLSNEHNRTVLARAPELGAPDWWLTAGAVFQTVWNSLDDRAPDEGIRDYDLFYFDDRDLSWEAEDAVIKRAGDLFADLDVVVEMRNEARVHLWYEEHFGTPARASSSRQHSAVAGDRAKPALRLLRTAQVYDR